MPPPPKFPGPQKYRMMLKFEDVRKDMITLNIVRLMDDILLSRGLNLSIVTYRILPIATNKGLLEIVMNAKTIGEIESEGLTIDQYLKNHNGEAKVNELNDMYARTLAGWTIITLLLGVGDRHQDNVMITTSGQLFHIDFGYILGKDAKPLLPRVRLTSKMLGPLGGVGSEWHGKFLTYCTTAYLYLRQHINLFYCLLMLLPLADPPLEEGTISAEYLESQLSQRFLPGKSDEEATAVLKSWLENSVDSTAGRARDGLHLLAGLNTQAVNDYFFGSSSSPTAIQMEGIPMTHR